MNESLTWKSFRPSPFLYLLSLAALVTAIFTSTSGRSSAQVGALSISGVIWRDDNANGQKDQGEPGIADAEVRLAVAATGGSQQTAKTDTDGRYAFSGLEQGQHQLRLSPTISGMWIQTYPSRSLVGPTTIDVSLASGGQTLNFGLYPSAGLPKFTGTAWRNAEPATEPTVRALVEGTDCTLPTLIPTDQPVNSFGLKVASNELIPGCGKDGASISFTINGTTTNETVAWRRAPIEQLPPGTVPSVPPPGAIGPPRENIQRIILTIGPPFAAYSGSVIDASTGERLDTASPPRFPGVDAYIGDTLCGSVPGYGLGGYVVVPSEQLKPGCGREGVTVRFVVDGAPAPEQVPWQPGLQTRTLTLSNAEVPAGVFRIVISAHSLNSPLSRSATGFDTLGQALGTLTVLANGTSCVQVDVAARQRDVVVELGRAGPPPDCATEGAMITFVDGRGIQLNARMTLTKGTQQRLSNLAPVPPSSGPSAGTSSQTGPTITPPDTGNAGLAAP
ncbi:MAG: hypothetical protein GEU75_10530 [Dehalococcoidia bacterium]|nr:hypothetical protein [Dehalococcoidia bacterium]